MTASSCSLSATDALPAFGALADAVKDRLVLLEDGFLYASPWVVSETARFSATFVVTVSPDDSFEFKLTGRSEPCAAVATRPFGKRCLSARGVPIVSIGVSPHHPSYRVFRSIGESGSLVLPRSLFNPLDAALFSFYSGRSTLPQLQALLDGLASIVAGQLPVLRCRHTDPRIKRVLRMLQVQPGPALDELAAVSGLSYDRMSHLFAEEVGLPLRSYLLAQKMQRACQLVGTGLNLTEIALEAGFADSAHFSKAWVKAFGCSPTHFFCNDRVEVLSGVRRAVDAGLRPATPF